MAAALPVAIILCLVALVIGALMYICMRRSADIKAHQSKEVRFEQNLLPGEPRDGHHKVSYLLLNCAYAEPGPVDYPSPEDVDREEVLQEHRIGNIESPLTLRGTSQVKRARDTRYEKYLQRVVACYSASTARCLETSRELLMIGSEFNKADRKALRCSRITPLECMSQYGIVRDNGRVAATKHCEVLQEALSQIGTNECDLQTLYECKVQGKPARSSVVRYTQQCVFSLTESLATDNKQALQQLRQGNNSDDDLVLIVGQTPYINAFAIALAGIMGHSVAKRKKLEEVNLAELDGFLITRSSRTTTNLTFEVDEAQTPFE